METKNSKLVLFNPRAPEELPKHIAPFAGKYGYTDGEELERPGSLKVLVHFNFNRPGMSDSPKIHGIYVSPDDLELIRIETAYQVLGFVTRSPDAIQTTIRKMAHQGRTPEPDIIQVDTPFNSEDAAWRYIHVILIPQLPQDKTFSFSVSKVTLVTKHQYV